MPYAPIITADDLFTHIYPEVINEIIRDDETIIPRAIDAAINEVKAYLGRFDTVQLFGDANLDSAATVNDEYLKDIVKDLTIWRVIRLSRVELNYDHVRICYEDGLKKLAMIQKGALYPQGWPYLDTRGQTAPQGSGIAFNSLPKRNNNF